MQQPFAKGFLDDFLGIIAVGADLKEMAQEDAGHIPDPSIHRSVVLRHGILPSYDLTREDEICTPVDKLS
jgi:hypothetical protein